uniref:Uncharacterized protein n=1 Tax=Trichobilharzia regenti TaxID=157069 RepID=A0AA85KCP6_TRIRE|nr:unnamed protein product [Trichobilharzia regenti]
MMSRRSGNPVNPLLCITVRLEHYVELRITDKYSTPVFQYRLEQHFSSPWKEPRRRIKTKLILTYTSVILKNASWWPYRSINSIDYKSIQKFITFNQENLRFAIGICDEDFAEKQYVVMSAKNFSDIEKLIQLIHSQLLIWKYSLKDEVDQFNPTKMNKKSMNSLKSIDKSTYLNDVNEQHSGNNTYKIRKVYNNNNSNNCQGGHGDKQRSHHTYTNLDDDNNVQTLETQQSTSHNCNCGNKGHKVKLNKKTRENEIKSHHKNCQTDTEYYYYHHHDDHHYHQQHHQYASYPYENDQKAWEVDIKYIRYDPVLGNILDDKGSVYLYTAHEIA